MSDTALIFIAKPFLAFAILVVVAIIARLVMRAIPEGRVKRLLSRRIGP